MGVADDPPLAGEELQRSVFDVLGEGVLVISLSGRLLQANPAAVAMLGLDLESARASADWWLTFAPRRADNGAGLDMVATVLSTGEGVRDVPAEIDGESGTALLSVNYSPLRDQTGIVSGLVISFRDVTVRERERQRLVDAQDRLREAHEVARLSSWEWQPATGEVLVFHALAEGAALAGQLTSLEQLLGSMPADAAQEARDDLQAFVRGEVDSSTRRLRYDFPTGQAWMENRSRAVRDADGRLLSVHGTSQDVTEQMASEHALLAARNYLAAVTDSMGEGLITLDPAGCVTYMNAAAEQLLGWALPELRGQVMHDLAHRRRADGSELPIDSSRILRAQREGKVVRVETDTFTRRDGTDFAVSYTASPFETVDGVHGCVVVFEDATERRERESNLQREADKLAWIDEVQDALAEDRLELYAQPIMHLRTREVVQQELLLRLRQRDGTIVGPGAFLPIIEQYGLIGDIDRWVIQRGTEIAATGIPVEMNISARSIGDPSTLEHIRHCVLDSGADPELLVFEMTETAIVEDEAAARVFAEGLHEFGCQLALDDFGTGWGSFTYLKALPVDYLKIDIEFVRDLVNNLASRHVVEAVVALASSFDLQTVAEGVEDAETIELLIDLGVDYAQGYHIAKPAPLIRNVARELPRAA